jgi:rRNA maturation endonuclease Nob1
VESAGVERKMKGKRHKSKKYDQYYCESNEPKTLMEVKVCKKCGRELPENSQSRRCPYCRGELAAKYVSKAQPANTS